MPAAVIGTQYSEKIEVDGGVPPYLWAVTAGELPPGLSLDINGIISGSPTSRGRYSFTVAVVDSAPWVTGYPSQAVFSDFSIAVNPAGFNIVDGLPPIASVGIVYTYQFTAAGGIEPYQWIVVDGGLPRGIGLANDGKLSGTPTSAGMFPFTIRANDSAGHEADQKYTIKVIDPPLIADASYKAKKAKLIITGEKFDILATLFIDGVEVKPKTHDSNSFVVKALTLSHGPHELRVVNPDGGTASVMINVE